MPMSKTMLAPRRTVPGPPVLNYAIWDGMDSIIEMSLEPPWTDGGSPVTGFRVVVAGAPYRQADFTEEDGFFVRLYYYSESLGLDTEVQVRAVNKFGGGRWSNVVEVREP